MPADQAGPAPRRGIPLWVILVGGGGLALFLYMRYRNNAATSGSTLGAGTTGVVTDPNTGLPVDPLTGLPYVTQPTNTPISMSAWISQAYSALVAAGVDPAAASQALYDYTNAQSLSSQEASIIDKALGLAGYPPQTLPFFGTVPTTGPTKAPATSGFITTTVWEKLTAAQKALYYAITTSNGAHGYLPIGTPLPTGAKLGYPGAPVARFGATSGLTAPTKNPDIGTRKAA